MTWPKEKSPAKERGYGHRHRALRRRYAALIASGRASCSRCGLPIGPLDQPCECCGALMCGRTTNWHLGHDDEDRSVYTGPEHACCNERAGALKGNRVAAARSSLRTWSRDWLG